MYVLVCVLWRESGLDEGGESGRVEYNAGIY